MWTVHLFLEEAVEVRRLRSFERVQQRTAEQVVYRRGGESGPA